MACWSCPSLCAGEGPNESEPLSEIGEQPAQMFKAQIFEPLLYFLLMLFTLALLLSPSLGMFPQ